MRNYLNDRAIVLVDDIIDNNRWDGAFEAFFEFVKISIFNIWNRCSKDQST